MSFRRLFICPYFFTSNSLCCIWFTHCFFSIVSLCSSLVILMSLSWLFLWSTAHYLQGNREGIINGALKSKETWNVYFAGHEWSGAKEELHSCYAFFFFLKFLQVVRNVQIYNSNFRLLPTYVFDILGKLLFYYKGINGKVCHPLPEDLSDQKWVVIGNALWMVVNWGSQVQGPPSPWWSCTDPCRFTLAWHA